MVPSPKHPFAPMKLKLALAMVSAGLFANAASAATTAFRGAPNAADPRTDNYGQAGWGFYATGGTQVVNQLGFWVSPSNSGGTGVLAVSHSVGLYNFNGANYTLLALATIPAGSTPDANGYAWASITPVTLTDTRAGADYYLVMASMGTDVWGPNTGGASIPVLNSSFGTPTGNGPANPNAFGAVSSTAAPTFTIGNGGYYGPNIGFAAVPEASSTLFVGIGVVALGLRRRRTVTA